MLASPSDYDLGQSLARLISQQGEAAFESGVISRRIQAQVQDLLGADTALASPLRDLLLRPAFRHLISSRGRNQSVGGREALLQDLAQVYSTAVVNRLDAVLQGCLGMPASPTPRAAEPAPQPAPAFQQAAASIPPPPPAATPPQVVTISSGNNGTTGALIAVLSLLAGALLVGLTGVLISSRAPLSSGNVPSTAPSSGASPGVAPPSATPLASQPPSPEASPPQPASAGTWQACVDYGSEDGPPPQPGETWWPVVGPQEALNDARRHCRPDAFNNSSGNVQIASFRDRDTAMAFAEQLTADESHPYRFWVGDPSVR